MIRVDKVATETNSPQTPCLAMRAREAAKAIGISERTLWDWTNKGLVPHVRRGSVILYPVEALRQWLECEAQTADGENAETKKVENAT